VPATSIAPTSTIWAACLMAYLLLLCEYDLAHGPVDRVCRRIDRGSDIQRAGMTREVFDGLTVSPEVYGVVQADRLGAGNADRRVHRAGPPSRSAGHAAARRRSLDARLTSTLEQRPCQHYSKSQTRQGLHSDVSVVACQSALLDSGLLLGAVRRARWNDTSTCSPTSCPALEKSATKGFGCISGSHFTP